MRAWGIMGVAAIGIAGAIAVYAYGDIGRSRQATQTEAPACDSCSARKKDLSRLREALSVPKADAD